MSQTRGIPHLAGISALSSLAVKMTCGQRCYLDFPPSFTWILSRSRTPSLIPALPFSNTGVTLGIGNVMGGPHFLWLLSSLLALVLSVSLMEELLLYGQFLSIFSFHFQKKKKKSSSNLLRLANNDTQQSMHFKSLNSAGKEKCIQGSLLFWPESIKAYVCIAGISNLRDVGGC